MSIAELSISIDSEKISPFCQERGIRRLSLFGYILRENFDMRHIDVDVRGKFLPVVLRFAGFQYFGYGTELTTILLRKVDFFSRLLC